jgi:formylglycine-generating enzyme required for sulfatase activity
MTAASVSGESVEVSRPPRKPVRLEAWRCPVDGLEYLFVPPTSFLMGAGPGDRDAGDAERPRHVVQLTRGYWLARTPVTVGAYRKFAEATGRAMREAPEFNANWERKQQPVVNVSWHDALAYCRWVGGRLPTEAEWECAARAGTSGRFWWGDEMDVASAWFQGNAGGQTRQVGLKRANPWGFVDMLGNVWEWGADCYSDDYYASSPPEDPRGPSTGSNRILRGGSWDSPAPSLRVSCRMRYGPALVTPFIGFRALIEAAG